MWALGESHYVKVTHNPSNCRKRCTEIQSSLPVAIYEHWNGRRWSLAPVSSARMMFEGPQTITATRDGGAWAAGGCYWQGIVTRWTGRAWVPAGTPPDVTWDPNTPTRDRHPPGPACRSTFQGPN